MSIIQGTFVGGRPVSRPPVEPPTQPPVQPSGGAHGHAFEISPQQLDLSRRRSGKPIPEPVRKKMESALGADFSDVRVHVGPEAGSIGALAFAHGSDIYFAPGLYEPTSTHGQRLLGHELAHIVQQRQGRVRNPFGAGVAVVQDPGLEAEAERLGMQAAAHVAPSQPPASAQAKLRSDRDHEDCEGAFQPKGPAGRPLAPHVAQAVGVGSSESSGAAQPREDGERTPAAHVQAALGGGPQAKPEAGATAQPKAHSQGYKLIVGAYMHKDARDLPEELAGHTFVSIQGPAGKSHTWGFSPDQYGSFQPKQDLGKLRSGVRGRVHDDQRAFSKPGLRTRTFAISEEQAKAATAKVKEYQAQGKDFSLQRRQCSTFALEVARAAEVDLFPGSNVRQPRDIHRQL